MDLFRSFAKDFVDLLYPQLCCGCSNPLLEGENLICTECLLTFPSTISAENSQDLMRKFEGLLPVDAAYSFLTYYKTGIVKELMHSVKYRGEKELGVLLGRMLGKAIQSEFSSSTPDMIIPIPLHPRKLRKRGFNQSFLLAQGLASVLGVGISDVLERSYDNPTQTSKSKVERIENTRELFAIRSNSKIEPGTHVLIVDDTLTTGSTVRAAGEVLAEGLGCRISIAVLALAK